MVEMIFYEKSYLEIRVAHGRGLFINKLKKYFNQNETLS